MKKNWEVAGDISSARVRPPAYTEGEKMKVRITYANEYLAEMFGLTEREQTIEVPRNSRYKDLLKILQSRLKGDKLFREDNLRETRSLKRIMDQLIFICNGRNIHQIEDDFIVPDSYLWIGQLIAGG